MPKSHFKTRSKSGPLLILHYYVKSPLGRCPWDQGIARCAVTRETRGDLSGARKDS